MLGRKKKKKADRQWMLDVKGRSGPVKALRLRMAAGALAISAGVVLALFVAWKGGEYALEEFVYSSPALAVETISIQSDGIIPLEQIQTWARVKKGENLLALDLARVKRDLELIPLIRAATVERILPHELVIQVHEREPIARIVSFMPREGDGLLVPSAIYLDDEGMVIPPVLRSLNAAGFDTATRYIPTITGISPAGLRSGRRAESPRLLAALRWIRAFEDSDMAGRVNVRSIDLSSETAMVVSTEQGNEVSFPPRNFEALFARWRRIHDFGLQNRLAIAALDLVVTNYIPAEWSSLTNNRPPAVRVNEPSAYRKRHV